jgi:hypothetical protein
MNPKPQSEEYRTFENLLGSVLKVTKKELSALDLLFNDRSAWCLVPHSSPVLA